MNKGMNFKIAAFLMIFSCSLTANEVYFDESINSKVLFIGDSQSVTKFGTLISSKLGYVKNRSFCESPKRFDFSAYDSDEVFLYATGGSSPRHWSDNTLSKNKGAWLCSRKWKISYNGEKQKSSTKKKVCRRSKKQKTSALEELVNLHRPDTVVFAFLGNSLFYYENAKKKFNTTLKQSKRSETKEENALKAQKDYLDKYFKPNLESMLRVAQNRKCLYITTNPLYAGKGYRNKNRKRIEFSEIIKNYVLEIAPHCSFIDGLSPQIISVMVYDKGNYCRDRTHLSNEGGEVFADEVLKAACELNYPELDLQKEEEGVSGEEKEVTLDIKLLL